MRSRLVGASGWLGAGRHAGGVLVVAGAFLFGGAASASAGVGFLVSPQLGGPLKAGDRGDASSLSITNASNGPEASQNVTLTTITLVPSCGTTAISSQDCPAASDDPGVLSVSPTATGEAGTACAGETFTTSVVDSSESKYQFTPAGGPVVLGATGGSVSGCTIDFTIDVLKAPTKDADPAPGQQTDQIGFAAGQASDAATGSGFGTGQVTISGPSTTSVYWDTNGNLSADPNPFGGSSPGGSRNVALGQFVLHSLTSGHDDLADGFQSLNRATTGSFDLAVGPSALNSTTTGSGNVALGASSLFSNQTGSNNFAGGLNALRFTTGSGNVGLGNQGGYNLTTGANNVDIANKGVAGEGGKIRIGTPGTQTSAFLAGVSGVTIPGPTKTVVVNASGQLGTAPAGTAPAAFSARASRRASTWTRTLALRLGRTSAQVRRQQTQIERLTQQNAQFASEIAQLRALITHRQ